MCFSPPPNPAFAPQPLVAHQPLVQPSFCSSYQYESPYRGSYEPPPTLDYTFVAIEGKPRWSNDSALKDPLFKPIPAYTPPGGTYDFQHSKPSSGLSSLSDPYSDAGHSLGAVNNISVASPSPVVPKIDFTSILNRRESTSPSILNRGSVAGVEFDLEDAPGFKLRERFDFSGHGKQLPHTGFDLINMETSKPLKFFKSDEFGPARFTDLGKHQLPGLNEFKMDWLKKD